MGTYGSPQSLAMKASSTEKQLDSKWIFYRFFNYFFFKTRVLADFWFCSNTEQKLQKVL